MNKEPNLNYVVRKFIGKIVEMMGEKISKNLEIDAILSHYTSIYSFKSIMESGVIRLGHVMFMNDPRDGMLLYDDFLDLMRDMLAGSEQEYALRAYEARLAGAGYVPPFAKVILDSDEKKKKRDRINYYLAKGLVDAKYEIMHGKSSGGQDIFSLSFVKIEAGDSVSNWISYGADGFGVRIDVQLNHLYYAIKDFLAKNGIKGDREEDILPDEMGFFRCIYMNSVQIRDLSKCFYAILEENIINNNDFSEEEENLYGVLISLKKVLTTISAIVKDFSYKNEEEVRLVISGLRGSPNFIGYNLSQSMMKPYREVAFSRNGVERIVCGPRLDARTVSSIRHFLNNMLARQVESFDLFKGNIDKGLTPLIKEIPVLLSEVRYVGK